ncbi:glycoside hydrolase family 30 beta sandwich domain-containing protein [Lutibacter sp. TH_r2]|uniref:glycoside hydrolase family 30 protein n=1 Tax=Lutibacter sp. TH_r2 TaxID=3082083 RepID=UPI0029542771|nr:glycoside hydrolase family 30 beta sandwich domain-containing protein [Lutibacter sp. TH_r2]MDV7188466.1 glycoside hydrolase family 30 beta sandwich domain-containing protein [Lutibacter sp. TH_r2]
MKNKIITNSKILAIILVCVGIQIGCKSCKEADDFNVIPPPEPDVVNTAFYLTKGDQSVLFAKQESGISSYYENNYATINVSTSEEYQEIDGFGYTLTGGSAIHINNMSSSARAELLNELFGVDENNIGVSYLRISIGASDLDEAPYSYNDLASGETDVNMDKFSINEDKKNLIPVLKEILAINPAIKILGSPWSPPVWMKTNQSTVGGSLKSEYYDVYAMYFVKYIQAMQGEGISIDAITVQNEPLNPENNPSLLMEASDQAEFVGEHLGPAFESNSIETKIIIYDHNADRTDYPISVLNNSEANKYIDGSAFHLYAGDINNLNDVKTAHPDKNLYFTEQWVGSNDSFNESLKWHTRELIIGATRNWCKTVLEWNLASNSSLEPHTDGGCTECLGALTIDGDAVTKNVAYYIIAHASKFIRPGSVRVDSNYLSELPNVAFKTSNGETIVVVLNNTDVQKIFNINLPSESITVTLDAGSVGTFVSTNLL